MDPFKILFVCTGNTCRSAMAAVMMNDIAVKRNLDVLIDSAGIFAQNGSRATANAVEAMAAQGIDLTAHRAKLLTPDLIDAADVVIVMTETHKSMLSEIAEGKVYILSEYAGGEGDIADPFGGDAGVYEAVALQIRRLLEIIAERL